MLETTCTKREPQDHGDRRAWCLEYCKEKQPALILILGNNSCCQDNFILLLTQERRSILQTSRDLLDPYMRSFQVRVASLKQQVHILTRFFARFQQTLPALNARSLGTIFFPLLIELVIATSSSQSVSLTCRTLGKFFSIIHSVVTHSTSNNKLPWKKRAGFLACRIQGTKDEKEFSCPYQFLC